MLLNKPFKEQLDLISQLNRKTVLYFNLREEAEKNPRKKEQYQLSLRSLPDEILKIYDEILISSTVPQVEKDKAKETIEKLSSYLKEEVQKRTRQEENIRTPVLRSTRSKELQGRTYISSSKHHSSPHSGSIAERMALNQQGFLPKIN